MSLFYDGVNFLVHPQKFCTLFHFPTADTFCIPTGFFGQFRRRVSRGNRGLVTIVARSSYDEKLMGGASTLDPILGAGLAAVVGAHFMAFAAWLRWGDGPDDEGKIGLSITYFTGCLFGSAFVRPNPKDQGADK